MLAIFADVIGVGTTKVPMRVKFLKIPTPMF